MHRIEPYIRRHITTRHATGIGCLLESGGTLIDRIEPLSLFSDAKSALKKRVPKRVSLFFFVANSSWTMVARSFGRAATTALE